MEISDLMREIDWYLDQQQEEVPVFSQEQDPSEPSSKGESEELEVQEPMEIEPVNLDPTPPSDDSSLPLPVSPPEGLSEPELPVHPPSDFLARPQEISPPSDLQPAVLKTEPPYEYTAPNLAPSSPEDIQLPRLDPIGPDSIDYSPQWGEETGLFSFYDIPRQPLPTFDDTGDVTDYGTLMQGSTFWEPDIPW